MNRRRFMAFLGALGPGLALARAGMGAPGPLVQPQTMLAPGAAGMLYAGASILVTCSFNAENNGTWVVEGSSDGGTTWKAVQA